MASSHEARLMAIHCPQCGGSLTPDTGDTMVCQYCGSSLIWSRPEARTTEPQEIVALRGMRLKQLTYTDSQGTGLELFRMLIPSGWQFEGGCRWLQDNPSMPAVVDLRVSNPQGAE